MFKRTSFQHGSLKREKRKLGPDVWIYRWREIGPDGIGRKPKVIIGSVDQFPSQALARRAVEDLGLGINRKKHQHDRQKTMTQLITHYDAKELSEERVNKTPYTCDVYRGYLKTWISPRWGSYKLADVKTADVESWLRSIDRADGTKVKIRNLMATLFNHAIRWEFIKANPITGPSRGAGVRQSGKRKKTPEVLTIQEIRSILNELPDQFRTLVFLFACTGMRFSELRGLRWMDVDFASSTLSIRRGVVKKYVGDLKTRASRRNLPLHEELITALGQHRAASAYDQPNNWVFASTMKKGTVPIWPTSLMEDHVRPAARRADVTKQVIWKMFRTSIATQLTANGENIKTAQQTLGHANSQITADVYTQAVPSVVRSAHDRLVDMVIASPPLTAPKTGIVGPILAPERSKSSLSR
jgi:integrase